MTRFHIWNSIVTVIITVFNNWVDNYIEVFIKERNILNDTYAIIEGNRSSLHNACKNNTASMTNIKILSATATATATKWFE